MHENGTRTKGQPQALVGQPHGGLPADASFVPHQTPAPPGATLVPCLPGAIIHSNMVNPAAYRDVSMRATGMDEKIAELAVQALLTHMNAGALQVQSEPLPSQAPCPTTTSTTRAPGAGFTLG